MKKPKVNFYERKFIVLFFLIFLLSAPLPTKAGMAVINPTGDALEIQDQIAEKVVEVKKWTWDKLWAQFKKIGSLTFQSTLQTALNTLVYDTATWIGSGDVGQKPLFTTEYLTELGSKARDAATSQFIETLSKEWSVDLCKPNFNLRAGIGLGLVQFSRPSFSDVDCGWQELSSNWTTEIDKWKSIYENPDDYSRKVSSMFNPSANDIAISLTLYTKMDEEGKKEEEKIKDQTKLNQGWLDVRNIGGKATTPPGQAERELLKADASQVQGLGKFTGNALLDASNIFLNQLAITAFNRFITGGGLVDQINNEKESGIDTVNTKSSFAYDADPNIYSGQGFVSEALKKVIKPRFDVRADYNIVSDLSVCLDPKNPMANNCVIDNRFGQAIQNKSTVISAIENGFINPNWIFDRDIDYRSGINYRSLIILRKFRIIPIGWEEAFLRAEEQTKKTGRSYTLMDMVSCFSPNDQYELFSGGFKESSFDNSSWCQGLVDPSWVLKAPLNYCKKEGFGGYIVTKQAINISKTNLPEEGEYNQYFDDSISSGIDPIIISRSDNYCADEQSCIKERSDGSCEYYGYCTEEKRIWNFGQDSCDPVYNTCESFTSGTSGKKLALLKNTIDYGSCSVDNVGCGVYSTSGSYNSSTKKIIWDSLSSIYLNKQAESCPASSEGCQEFIRVSPGSGHNFISNGGFEEGLGSGSWSISSSTATTTDSKFYSGAYSMLLSSSAISINTKVAADNHVIAGESYVLSFYSSCSATSTVSLGSKNQNIAPSDNFSYQVINNTFPNNYSYNTVGFTINAAGDCYIDDVKLERGISGTFYSDYRDNGLIYQKMIPDYLKLLCYENPISSNPDFRLKNNAPSECYNYARLCNKDEIGCDTFTSIYKIKTNAKALEKDYCPGQCSGYDVYIQNSTLFESKILEKMIPQSATACSASDSGCTEFTNLDNISAGGEGKEYYIYLRHCIKPAQGSCDNFYSWEGSNESGYQLKSFKLERVSTNEVLPKLTQGSLYPTTTGSSTIWSQKINNIDVCNQYIYNSPLSSLSYNPDCREFYNQSGDLIYVLYSTSITCSDNCKPYRMTEKNIDATISNSNSCIATADISRSWDSELSVCYSCLGGGKWDNTQKACIYQAIPGEGKTCSASANNCREYNGNSGNNVRIASVYDFNSGLGAWSGSATSSLESLNQGGGSMNLSGVATATIGTAVSEGASYVVKFSAKSNQNRNLKIGFSNDANESVFGVTGANSSNYSIIIPASSEWQPYQVSLERLDHSVDLNEKLFFNNVSGGNIYISDIVVLEISSRYYLIKNSWNTPEICYYDTLNNYRGVNYNLGCQPYIDSSNINHNLRQFSSLCSDSALGCQMMIQTNNYAEASSKIFNDTNNDGICNSSELDCVVVLADKFLAVVYDPNKSCSSANMGCSRLGKLISSNPYVVSQNLYSDVYLKNNPNKYTNILCDADDVGCDAWSASAGSGTYYFKDPGDNLCQWRKGSDVNSNFAWYKKAVKKCKSGSNFINIICSSNSDCSSDQTCELDTGDYLCPVNSMKTIGYGGAKAVYQPDEQAGIKWAGLCPIKQAGCTEYIDPYSSFSSSIVLNPNFADLDNDGVSFDYWIIDTSSTATGCSSNGNTFSCSNASNASSSYIVYNQYNLAVEPHKLYILESRGEQEAILSCSKNIYQLASDNKLATSTKTLSATPTDNKVIFYSGENEGSCNVQYKKQVSSIIKASSSSTSEDISVNLREASLDYQLSQNLDFTSCNARANFNDGCVIFNERSYSPAGYPSLNYTSSNYSNYSTCNSNSCDANKLIKVSQDRVCGKWLSCSSYSYNTYTEEKSCLDLGECTTLNYDGSCFDFSKPPDGIRTYDPSTDLNSSGYSLLGVNYLSNMKQLGDDLYSDGFEDGGNIAWHDWHNSATTLKASSCLINKPNHPGISGKNVSYPADGRSFLKIGGDCANSSGYSASNIIETKVSSDYYLSLMINTGDLGLGGYAVISILGVGVTSTGAFYYDFNSIEDQGSEYSFGSRVDRKSGWQEFSMKFKTKDDWTNGVIVLIHVIKQDNKKDISSPVFIDNLRIASVLEVEKDKQFISPSCRLYPSEGSLSCKSESSNIVSDGWYGYCLQKDPKNSEVCLMWYPVDAIKTSGAPSSAFPGYSASGQKPYYCAEMSANFELVNGQSWIKVFDYSSSECSSFSGSYTSGNSSTPGYCSIEHKNYVPKCTKIVQGEIPWVSRLLYSPENISKYSTSSLPTTAPFAYYRLNKYGSPFGAIKNDGAKLSSSSPVYAGQSSLSGEGKFYGLPYSCNNFGKTYSTGSPPNSLNTFSTCRLLYFDTNDGQIKMMNPTSGNLNDLHPQNYSTYPDFTTFLKHIFLKVKNIRGEEKFDYTANSSTPIPGSAGTRASTTQFIAIFPEIEDIELKNSLGAVIDKKSDDTYTITSPGFYTIVFNTRVDSEQAPIAKLTARIKKEGTAWNVNEGFIELVNIDSISTKEGGHRIFRYLSPGDYKILIKIVDNWGFYKCVGLSGFNDSAKMISPQFCYNCCVTNNFLDTPLPVQSKSCELCN